MAELFDKPQSPLKLTDAELKALRASVPRGPKDRGARHYLKGITDAQLADAEYLRRGWHGLLRACRKLTEDRLRAAIARLDEGFGVEDLRWAIKAYAAEIGKDVWRQQNPQARLTFERFLNGDRFELYVDLGEQLADAEARIKRHAAQRRRERYQARVSEELLDTFLGLPFDERKAMIERAVAQLEARGKLPGSRSIDNPFVRNQVLRLMQRDEQNAGSSASLGEALEEALS